MFYDNNMDHHCFQFQPESFEHYIRDGQSWRIAMGAPWNLDFGLADCLRNHLEGTACFWKGMD